MNNSAARRAYHEGGHIIAALSLGMPVEYATIDANRPHVLVGPNRLLERRAIMALSGPEAERMVFGDPLPDGVDDHDLANARRYLRPLYTDAKIGQQIARLRDTAFRLVRQPRSRHWIETIAQALLDYRTLSGDEIEMILRWPLGRRLARGPAGGVAVVGLAAKGPDGASRCG